MTGRPALLVFIVGALVLLVQGFAQERRRKRKAIDSMDELSRTVEQHRHIAGYPHGHPSIAETAERLVDEWEQRH